MCCPCPDTSQKEPFWPPVGLPSAPVRAEFCFLFKSAVPARGSPSAQPMLKLPPDSWAISLLKLLHQAKPPGPLAGPEALSQAAATLPRLPRAESTCSPPQPCLGTVLLRGSRCGLASQPGPSPGAALLPGPLACPALWKGGAGGAWQPGPGWGNAPQAGNEQWGFPPFCPTRVSRGRAAEPPAPQRLSPPAAWCAPRRPSACWSLWSSGRLNPVRNLGVGVLGGVFFFNLWCVFYYIWSSVTIPTEVQLCWKNLKLAVKCSDGHHLQPD